MEVTVDLKTIINKLQAAFDRIQKLEEENKKLRDALKLFAFPEGKLEHENVERVSRQVLKEVGEE